MSTVPHSQTDSSPRYTHSSSALPGNWEGLWGSPAEPHPLGLQRLKRDCAALAREIKLLDHGATFGALVGSRDLRAAPVHRWFTYKEGYSPCLLSRVIDVLGLEGPLKVADTFGGVATTALSALTEDRVGEVRSLEYSPWARFVGQTKLDWPRLSPERLAELLPHALRFPFDPQLDLPELSSFSNPRIFHRRTVQSLLSAREHLRVFPGAADEERRFFLLGLGAVIEDLSRAMKDGRALRVRGGRRRRRSSLVVGDPRQGASRVRWFLGEQWRAMIGDLRALAGQRHAALATPSAHVAGDARVLGDALLDNGQPAFPARWADLTCFSPPYLNCIDYSELYKLELWLMEHVASHQEFRRTRLGTLRSHPSAKFDPRGSFTGVQEQPAVRLVGELSQWLCEHGTRRDVGPVVRTYFEDMYEVWRQQHRLLREDGVAVCVVANSTFARRQPRVDGARRELWRLPLLTDVVLSHLALLAGFPHVEIWDARALRPRNVRRGAARESLVVAYRGDAR